MAALQSCSTPFSPCPHFKIQFFILSSQKLLLCFPCNTVGNFISKMLLSRLFVQPRKSSRWVRLSRLLKVPKVKFDAREQKFGHDFINEVVCHLKDEENDQVNYWVIQKVLLVFPSDGSSSA